MDRVLDLVAAIEATASRRTSTSAAAWASSTTATSRRRPPMLCGALLHALDARGSATAADDRAGPLAGRQCRACCVTEVLYLKPGEQKNFCIVDAAMNDLPRPAMYEAYHQIVPVPGACGKPLAYDVVGPVCESGDWIGPTAAAGGAAGDLLAVLSAGAYCMSMASSYNARGRAAEGAGRRRPGAPHPRAPQPTGFANQTAERLLPPCPPLLSASRTRAIRAARPGWPRTPPLRRNRSCRRASRRSAGWPGRRSHRPAGAAPASASPSALTARLNEVAASGVSSTKEA